MAKRSTIARQAKRERLVAKYAALRKELKEKGDYAALQLPLLNKRVLASGDEMVNARVGVDNNGLPAVDVSFGLENSPFPRVVTDSLAATRLAADHLLERGFTFFGYCGDNRYHWSRLRGDLFAGHVRTAGHKCDTFEGRPARGRGDVWESEIHAIAEWLRRLLKPVGILACYDIRGQQVLEACRQLNIAVPDEVAVIGVHNDQLLCELCDPPLSSVIPNARRAGYEPAALLARMMRGEKIPPQPLLLAPIGVEGGVC